MADYDDDPFAERPKSKAISWAEAPDGATITLKLDGPASKAQKRSYDDPDVLLYWDKEQTKPRYQAVVNGTLIAGDLGTDSEELRSLWADIPSSLFAAIAAAQTKAGVKLAANGLLTVKLTGRKKNPDKPRNKPANQFAARYEPPAESDPWASDSSAVQDDEPPF